MTDLSAKRDKENQLRTELYNLRRGLDTHYQEKGYFPGSIGLLLETSTSQGGFYLRRWPINPISATTTWEIASRSTGQPTDYWKPVCLASETIDSIHSPIVDIRCPDIGTGVSGKALCEF